MKLLRHYIAKQLFRNTLFTLVALLGVYSFFDIVEEITKVGKSNYTTGVMLQYVLLLLPSHAYELMPLAVLIGVMITMSLLVSHNEYTIIRTSGVSIYQVGGVLIRFGIFFAVVAALLGDFIVPSIQEKANRIRLDAFEKTVKGEYNSSIWVKNDNRLINVGTLKPDGTIGQLKVYQYSDDSELQKTLTAQEGAHQGNGIWALKQVDLTQFSDNKVTVEHHEQYQWKSILEPKVLDVLLVVPEQMSARNLNYYINHLKKNNQQTRRYEIALWGKLFYPLACVSMALIALAFTPRQSRQGGLGVRLFFGICLGVGFHFFNRFCSYLGLLYSWNPTLVATLPTLLFLCAGLYVISRQERV